MANWSNIGIGLNAALQGFEQGQGLVRNIQGIQKDRKLKSIREEGMAGAQTAREADITRQIRANGMGGYEVDGKSYADEGSARKAAEGNVDEVLDYYRRDTVPKLRDAYIADGDIEKADAFQRWNENRDVQKGQREWARGMRAYATGDMKGAARSFVKAWNVEGYGLGGVKDARPIEKDGQTVGFEFDIDDGQGGTRTEKVEGDELIRRGIATLAPNQMFEVLYREQSAADQARATAAAEARKEGIKFQQDVALEGVRQTGREQLADRNAAHEFTKLGVQQDNAIELEGVKAQLKAAETRNGTDSPLMRDYLAMVAILEQSGKPPEEARQLAAERKLYRLSQSPQDRVRSTMSDLAKTDLRFSQLTPDQQMQKVREVMAAEDALVADMGGGGAPATPAATGAKPKGVPYYDIKTGQTVYR